MGKYAVAATLIQDKKNGILNISTELRTIEAASVEEAIGKYMVILSEEYPEHYVHRRPLAMPMEV